MQAKELAISTRCEVDVHIKSTGKKGKSLRYSSTIEGDGTAQDEPVQVQQPSPSPLTITPRKHHKTVDAVLTIDTNVQEVVLSGLWVRRQQVLLAWM